MLKNQIFQNLDDEGPLLSICISTYNRAKWLELSLQNLSKIFKENIKEIEILICDNASVDETEEIVSKYINVLDIKYYKNKKNVGMIGNLSVTASLAKGDYIWILGDDDLILEETPGLILNEIINNKGIDLLYLNYAYVTESAADKVNNLDEFLQSAIPISDNKKNMKGKISDIATQSENFFTAIYCIVFRRDHALRAYSQFTNEFPFSSMKSIVPTTFYVINNLMNLRGIWIGKPLVIVNMNVSWMQYADLWILERLPEVFDAAELNGSDPNLVDKYRINLLNNVPIYFEKILDKESKNYDYFSILRFYSRFKHLDEFSRIKTNLDKIIISAIKRNKIDETNEITYFLSI